MEDTPYWKILNLFSKKPSKSFFVNEIARILNISTSASSITCKKLNKDEILLKNKKGNMVFYSLNNNFLTREVKKYIFLSDLYSCKKILENPEYQTVAVYGSYANGEYIEKSDIDFLIITNINEKKTRENLKELNKLNKEISFLIMPFSKWLELKKKNEPIYKEIVANNILLYGEKLVI
jgi:hypothetical protein